MSVLGVGGIYVNKATMSMLGIDVINEETVSGGGGGRYTDKRSNCSCEGFM